MTSSVDRGLNVRTAVATPYVLEGDVLEDVGRTSERFTIIGEALVKGNGAFGELILRDSARFEPLPVVVVLIRDICVRVAVQRGCERVVSICTNQFFREDNLHAT